MAERDDTTLPDVNEELNPHRGEEQERARERAEDVLSRRGVLLFGDESDDELANLWSAVDRFESVVEARGGDTMTNSPDSDDPEKPYFLIPERRARESPSDFSSRSREAAENLTHLER
jgi:hypothetical protein